VRRSRGAFDRADDAALTPAECGMAAVPSETHKAAQDCRTPKPGGLPACALRDRL